MSDASRDQNRVPSLIASSDDGLRTPVDIWSDSTTHRLKVNSTITGAVGGIVPDTPIAFLTTVTTAGTRVQLASNAVSGVIIQAPSTNTGLIYVSKRCYYPSPVNEYRFDICRRLKCIIYSLWSRATTRTSHKSSCQ